jgi:hypothetical protein
MASEPPSVEVQQTTLSERVQPWIPVVGMAIATTGLVVTGLRDNALAIGNYTNMDPELFGKAYGMLLNLSEPMLWMNLVAEFGTLIYTAVRAVPEIVQPAINIIRGAEPEQNNIDRAMVDVCLALGAGFANYEAAKINMNGLVH